MVYDAGLGNTEKVSVCDLWHQKDLGEYKALIPQHFDLTLFISS